MAKAIAGVNRPVPASQVWDLIGGFDSLPDWLPYIPKSQLSQGGRIRRLVDADGGVIVERLMTFDEEMRSYSYRILEAPFPQEDYVASLQVWETDEGRGSRVEWCGQFTPLGVSEAEVIALVQGIYEAGLSALAAHYGR